MATAPPASEPTSALCRWDFLSGARRPPEEDAACRGSWTTSLRRRWDSRTDWRSGEMRDIEMAVNFLTVFSLVQNKQSRCFTCGGCYGCCSRGPDRCSRESGTSEHFRAWPELGKRCEITDLEGVEKHIIRKMLTQRSLCFPVLHFI